MSDWIAVGPVDDIPSGSWKTVETDDTVIAVFNLDGEFHALEDICTHDYIPLTDGGDVCDDQVICPRHGACFDIRTGEALTPPAYESITVFPTRVVDGVVHVRDHRDD